MTAAIDPHVVNRDPALLHPEFRARVAEVQARLDALSLPFAVFEAWRSPERQADLYAQGRTKPGLIVTYAPEWSSFHQFGLAVDFVLRLDGHWSWDDKPPHDAWWRLMQEAGNAAGLTGLGFEQPHLQLAKVSLIQLRRGDYPFGGDRSWRDNLTAALRRWRGPKPPAPKAGA
jgi:peptidoglycan L-alanyl-D-glutamate endopeptidase CwlK